MPSKNTGFKYLFFTGFKYIFVTGFKYLFVTGFKYSLSRGLSIFLFSLHMKVLHQNVANYIVIVSTWLNLTWNFCCERWSFNCLAFVWYVNVVSSWSHWKVGECWMSSLVIALDLCGYWAINWHRYISYNCISNIIIQTGWLQQSLRLCLYCMTGEPSPLVYKINYFHNGIERNMNKTVLIVWKVNNTLTIKII